MRKPLRGIAVPCFGDDPAGFADLGVAVEEAGFDGYFSRRPVGRVRTGESPRPAAADMAKAVAQIAATRDDMDGYDVVVWAEVAKSPAEVTERADSYARAGATWWIETAWPGPDWWQGIRDRVAAGP